MILRNKFAGELRSFCILVFVNLIIYHNYWLGKKIISGKDFLTLFYPLLNYQSDCLQERSWPLWNPFMNFGFPYVEHYANTSFFPTHLLMGLLTGAGLEFIQWELLFWITVGGFGMYLLVIEQGSSRLAGILAAISFMFCGQMIELPQWSLLVYNASCFPFLLFGYHRALKAGTTFSPVSILFLAMSILGGYAPTAVLSIYFFAGYVLIESSVSGRKVFGVKFLAVTITAGLLLSLPKLLPIYYGMETGPRLASPVSAAANAPKDTFNIITLYNFMSLLVPVKYYFSLYIGTLCMVSFFYGVFRKRLTAKAVLMNPLLLMTVLSAWVLLASSDGSVSLLRSLSSVLPLMKLVRNEWFCWFFPSIFAILYLAGNFDDFLNRKDIRAALGGVIAYIILASAFFFTEYNIALYFKSFLTHVVAALLWLSLTFIAPRRKIQGVLAFMLITAEFIMVFNRVSIDEAPLKYGDSIRFTVVDQAAVNKSYMEDNRARFRFYAEAVQDGRRPSLSESRSRPYLISGLGGADMINAYPEQYGNFIDSMNLKQFAGWWYNSQERFDFIELKDSPLLLQLNNQPLFYFMGDITAKPLYDTASFDRISCSGFDFSIKTNEPGVFVFRQMYDDRWKVFLDNTEFQPLRAERYFMGVPTGAGLHVIHFAFEDRKFVIAVVVSGLALLTLITATVLKTVRRKRSG